jgi:hypothetical protein
LSVLCVVVLLHSTHSRACTPRVDTTREPTGNVAFSQHGELDDGGGAAGLLLAAAEAEQEERDAADDAVFALSPPVQQPESVSKTPPAVAPKPAKKGAAAAALSVPNSAETQRKDNIAFASIVGTTPSDEAPVIRAAVKLRREVRVRVYLRARLCSMSAR